MRQRPFLRRGFRATLLAAVVLAMAAPPKLFADPPGLGGIVVGNGSPVRVEILAASADFTCDIFVIRLRVIEVPVYIGTNHDTGKIVSFESFRPGEEIAFKIVVRETGDVFYTGSGIDNPDGLPHAAVEPLGGGAFRVAFEDTRDGGDLDYDDVIFKVMMGTLRFGLDQNPLGAATLDDTAGGLVVSAIGASGNDGLSIRLGDADGVRVISKPLVLAVGSRLTYTLNDAAGNASGAVTHEQIDARQTRLTFGYPAASSPPSLNVEAFLAGRRVETQVLEPAAAKSVLDVVFSILDYVGSHLCYQYTKTTTVRPDGTTTTVETTTIKWKASTTAKLSSNGNAITFDELVVTANRAGSIPASRELRLTGVDVPPLTITSEAIKVFNSFTTGLGDASLDARDGTLVANRLGTGGGDGFAFDLPEVTGFSATWSPLLPLGLTGPGAFLDLSARGTIGGVPDQLLGRLRLTQVDGKAEITADLSGVNSPTQRIEVLYRGQPVAVVTGHTGPVARTTSWPTGAGKFGRPPIGSTTCFILDFPDGTWIVVPDGPKVLGDQIFILSESPDVPVESLSKLEVTTSGIPAITLTGDSVASFDAPAAASCVPGPDRLCLDSRFAVEADWRDFAGHEGRGHAVPMTHETGYFWFFDPGSIEAAVKVLDGRALNGKWWVFHGGLSNVEYRITVTDTLTGARRVYDNAMHQIASAGDLDAFDDAPAASASPAALRSWPGAPAAFLNLLPDKAAPVSPAAGAGGCGDAAKLCLQDGRFEVEIAWRDFQGHSGRGQNIPMTRESGYFWFFDPANAEVFVKVLDGRAVDGRWWLFYGSLSNVEYEITVRDTATGKTRTYSNPAGHFASGMDAMR